MNLTPAGVSLGGAAIGTAILALAVQRWWLREGHGPAAIAPFVLSALYGMLVVLTAGGLLGTAANITLWGGNGLGDLALVYGVGGNSPDATRAQNVALTDGGHVIVLILTALVAGAWMWSHKLPRMKVFAGTVCGICLGLNAGVAGTMAVPLANAANLTGAWWSGVLS